MNYITDEDYKKSKRHEELENMLKEASEMHLKISQEYYDGNASAEEVVAILNKLNEIQDEWRKTLTLLKKST